MFFFFFCEFVVRVSGFVFFVASIYTMHYMFDLN